MNKKEKNIRHGFIITTFFVLLFITLLVAISGYFITKDARFTPKPFIPLFIMVLTCVLLGTFLFGMISNVVLKPVNEISEATKLVAKGDFSVRLDEEQRVKEMQEIFKNFNIMTRELASTEMLREDFIVNVSHQFKTPLAAIEGSSTLLQDENISLKERREFTQMIIQSTQQLSSLTGNILNISKLDSSEFPLEMNDFRLDEQLRRAVLLLEKEWVDKNLVLEIDCDEVVYRGNEALLFQVWVNLLDNAIKYSKPDGKLRVALYTTRSGYSIQIEDTGVGISEASQKHIFEKFYQSDNAKQVGGNGLGLALVWRIIKRHNGTILVKSEEGVGTTFTVRLPKDPAGEEERYS